MIPDHVKQRHIGYMAMAQRCRMAGNTGRAAYWLIAARTVRQAYFKRAHYVATRTLLTFH